MTNDEARFDEQLRSVAVSALEVLRDYAAFADKKLKGFGAIWNQGANRGKCIESAGSMETLLYEIVDILPPREFHAAYQQLEEALEKGKSGFLVLAEFSDKVSLFTLSTQGTGQMEQGSALLGDCERKLRRVVALIEG